jgi:hypothetical protein
VGVCGGDDEFVDFKRVGVLGGGGTDTEVVAFWEIDLYGLLALYRTSVDALVSKRTLSVLKHDSPSMSTSR